MRSIQRLAATSILVLLITGCEGGRKDDALSVAEGKQWAADACRTLPADALAKAAGETVRSAIAGAKSTVGGIQVSTCTYQTSGDAAYTVLMRDWGDKGGGASQTVAGLHAMPEITGPVSELKVDGATAYWVPKHRTLSYIPDDKRVVVVTPPMVPGVTEAAQQQTAMKIARAAATARPAAN